MRDPPRLLDTTQRPVEQALLRSAEQDAPTEAARAAALVGLGLDRPLAPVASGAGALSAKVAAAVVMAGALWIGVSIITAPKVAVAPAPAPEPQMMIPAAGPPAPERIDPPPAVEPAPAPAVVTARRVRPKPQPRPAAPVVAPEPTPRDSLSEELRLLDLAREALAHDNTRLALRTLATYHRRFPRGALTPESRVLQVRSLVRAGRSEDAQEELTRLRRSQPAHPALGELERLLGTPGGRERTPTAEE